MPTLLGQLNVDYQGVEANEILFDPVFMDEDILSTYRVMPNVVSKKKMQFARKLEKIVRKYTGCGFSPIGKMEVYEREIFVERMKADIELCVDEFQDTILEELLRRGDRFHDLQGTPVENILIQRMREALRLDIDRIVHFGNTSSTDPNYEALDGFWTVIYKKFVTDGLMAYVNTGSGTALSDGGGISLLKQVYDKAPLQLKGLPNSEKQFNVSSSVYNQYIEDIENGGGGDFGLISMVNGMQSVTFRGIPVIPRWRWDQIMTSDLNSANSHLIEFTTPANKVIATDLINAQDQLTIWHDEYKEKLYIKTRWKLGANIIHPSLAVVGY